jgi:hypothetical protein
MKRTTLLVAVAFTTALTIWTIGRLALGELAQSTGLIAAGALLITQCIMSIVISPWLACDAKSGVMTGLISFVITPWPLLLLIIQISGISIFSMLTSQIWVAALIVLSYFSARGLRRILREDQWRTIALTVLQLVPATVLWAGRNAWVPWFTS